MTGKIKNEAFYNNMPADPAGIRVSANNVQQ
jgi:hypothetical protein